MLSNSVEFICLFLPVTFAGFFVLGHMLDWPKWARARRSRGLHTTALFRLFGVFGHGDWAWTHVRPSSPDQLRIPFQLLDSRPDTI
jgi:hypothetical protein